MPGDTPREVILLWQDRDMNKIDPTNVVVGENSPVPKLLVISSYRRPCGIAQYLEFLEGPLRRLAVDVEIAPLPVDLLRG